MLSFSFTVAFLLHLLLFATGPMVTMMMEEMGLSCAELGFVYSAGMIGLIFFKIPWELMGDRIGYLDAFWDRIANLCRFCSAKGILANLLNTPAKPILPGLRLAAVLPCLALIVKDWALSRPLRLLTAIYVSGFAVGNPVVLGLTLQLLRMIGWRDLLFVYGCMTAVVYGPW